MVERSSLVLTSTGCDITTGFPETTLWKFNERHPPPSDDMILMDGTLWDPRQRRIIQKFEMLPNDGLGHFHLHGNEVR